MRHRPTWRPLFHAAWRADRATFWHKPAQRHPGRQPRRRQQRAPLRPVRWHPPALSPEPPLPDPIAARFGDTSVPPVSGTKRRNLLCRSRSLAPALPCFQRHSWNLTGRAPWRIGPFRLLPVALRGGGSPAPSPNPESAMPTRQELPERIRSLLAKPRRSAQSSRWPPLPGEPVFPAGAALASARPQAP